MGFLQRIFSSKTFTAKDALKLGFSSNYNDVHIDIKDKNDCLEAYRLTPTVRAIVNKKASVVTNFKLKEENSQGEEKKDSAIISVFSDPHPLYSPGEFWRTLSIQWDLFDEIFIYKIQKNINGLIEKGDKLLVLPANLVEVIPVDKPNYREGKELSDFVKGYTLNLNNETLTFRPDEIIHITKTAINFDNILEADLSLKAANGAINSILAGYNVRNTLWNRNGGFGVIYDKSKSGINQDMTVNEPMDKKEKDELQKELKSYSFNRNDYNIIIATREIGWLPITYPIKDMDLVEGFKQANKDIANVLDFPELMLNDLDNATYANKPQGEKELYNNTTIPFWKLLQDEFNRQKLTLPSNKIVFDYSEIKALISDKKTELETERLTYENAWILFTRNQITFNQMQTICGLETISGMDNKFYIDLYINNENTATTT